MVKEGERGVEITGGAGDIARDFKSEVSEEYVETEDFEELLEEALRRAATERAKVS